MIYSNFNGEKKKLQVGSETTLTTQERCFDFSNEKQKSHQIELHLEKRVATSKDILFMTTGSLVFGYYGSMVYSALKSCLWLEASPTPYLCQPPLLLKARYSKGRIRFTSMIGMRDEFTIILREISHKGI